MALAFPTPLDSFFAKLPINQCTPDLTESVEMNETGYGEILTADLGTRLWQMDIAIRNGNYNDLEKIRALINVYRQAGRSFFAHAVPSKFPQYDPDGLILGSNTPRLYSVNANMRDVIISGLPNAYKIQAGDCLSFQYGSNPTRYAFHQVVSDATAASNGRTTVFEVIPAIRPGYSTNSIVQLVRPYFKAMIIPGSVKMGKTGSRETSGISFSLIQTLRN